MTVYCISASYEIYGCHLDSVFEKTFTTFCSLVHPRTAHESVSCFTIVYYILACFYNTNNSIVINCPMNVTNGVHGITYSNMYAFVSMHIKYRGAVISLLKFLKLFKHFCGFSSNVS